MFLQQRNNKNHFNKEDDCLSNKTTIASPSILAHLIQLH